MVCVGGGGGVLGNWMSFILWFVAYLNPAETKLRSEISCTKYKRDTVVGGGGIVSILDYHEDREDIYGSERLKQ